MSEWNRLYDPITNQSHTHQAQLKSPTLDSLFEVPNIAQDTTFFQWDNRYIVAPTPAGLMLVHQHRAHVCVIYKVLLEQLKNKQAATQPLLFPEIIELTQNDFETLEQLLPELLSIGFVIEQFSPMAYAINAVPALLGQKSPTDAILQLIHQVQDTEQSAEHQWQEMIALGLAEQMAIPQGKALTEMEMRDLIERLHQSTSSRYLPNGQIISTFITHEDIQKRF